MNDEFDGCINLSRVVFREISTELSLQRHPILTAPQPVHPSLRTMSNALIRKLFPGETDRRSRQLRRQMGHRWKSFRSALDGGKSSIPKQIAKAIPINDKLLLCIND